MTAGRRVPCRTAESRDKPKFGVDGPDVAHAEHVVARRWQHFT